MAYPINDTEMEKEIVLDLVNAYEFTQEKAEKLAPEIAPYIIDKMWDEYSEALSYAIEGHEND